MRARFFAVAAAVVAAAMFTPRAAQAQEVVGAGPIEIDSAIFGGGTLLVDSADASDSRSHSYVVSGAFTANINRWFGIEGDLAWAIRKNQAHEIYGVVPAGPHPPSMLLYTGNLVYNPFGSNRRVVPYVTGGLGGLTTFTVARGSTFGLPGDRSFLVGSAGGGARWFPIQHWGVRGDYRLVRVRRGDDVSAPGGRLVRSAHRLYGALVLTF